MEEQPSATPDMDVSEQPEEDWDDDEDYDEEDDADIDAEALEIARRLGEQIWADITKGTAEGNAAPTETPSGPVATEGQNPAAASENVPPTTHPVVHPPRKEEAIIATMKAILNLLENDPLAKSALVSTTIPNGPNVYDILLQCNALGTISTGIAGPLSQVIVTLARSTSLFGNLKRSNASAIQLDKGKRKREEFDDGNYQPTYTYKRPYVPDFDLQNQVVEAVRIISQALGTSPSQAIDPSLVSSIRLQLHQIFLFAVTSAAAAGPSMHALQEIGGLIQVIGVLSGIQIGHSPENIPHPHPHGQSFGPNPVYSWNQNQHSMTTDIGTAVYPCLVVGCHKTFSRLYSLRAHQRSHSSHRPFRCSVCPASFARNHDLKRHLKLHDKKAWKCEGCHKIFSRRDAIKRHKTGTKSRGPKSEICLVAEVIEVQLDGEEGEDALREERRAKIWNGIVVNEASGVSTSNSQHPYRDIKTIDEGEINPAVIAHIQTSVIGLHGLLQVLVGNALGNPVGHPTSAPMDPSGGQATLASVIARAQSQSIPASTFVPSPLSAQGSFGQTSDSAMDTSVPTSDESLFQPQTVGENPENPQPPLTSLSMYGLSDEQTQLLEIAIASAASAAQAQAEAEAALEEEEEDNYDQDDNEYDDSEVEQDKEPVPQ
ncbi:hypothetical protein CVT25_008189 [Psilocybe cyanescens]|uniref:C2H2-type domain-containing protein n=1 Tax=Psilocybe cyanescens TaxID=93625 RepID=A0A409X9L7_PSICY|nr:hypothetical protein CVT25_008189 [Psilocybe cyanescens]